MVNDIQGQVIKAGHGVNLHLQIQHFPGLGENVPGRVDLHLADKIRPISQKFVVFLSRCTPQQKGIAQSFGVITAGRTKEGTVFFTGQCLQKQLHIPTLELICLHTGDHLS